MSTMCARAAKRYRRRATPPLPPPRRTPAGTGWWSCSEGSAHRLHRAPRRWASQPARQMFPGSRNAASRATRHGACRRGFRAGWSAGSAGSRAERRVATNAASAAGWPSPRKAAPAAAEWTTLSRRAWSYRPDCGFPNCYWASRAKTESLAGCEVERAEGRAAATADDIGRPWLMREPENRTLSPHWRVSIYIYTERTIVLVSVGNTCMCGRRAVCSGPTRESWRRRCCWCYRWRPIWTDWGRNSACVRKYHSNNNLFRYIVPTRKLNNFILGQYWHLGGVWVRPLATHWLCFHAARVLARRAELSTTIHALRYRLAIIDSESVSSVLL